MRGPLQGSRQSGEEPLRPRKWRADLEWTRGSKVPVGKHHHLLTARYSSAESLSTSKPRSPSVEKVKNHQILRGHKAMICNPYTCHEPPPLCHPLTADVGPHKVQYYKLIKGKVLPKVPDHWQASGLDSLLDTALPASLLALLLVSPCP